MFAGVEDARDPVGLRQQRCIDYRKAETRAESGKINWYKEMCGMAIGVILYLMSTFVFNATISFERINGVP